MEVITGITWMSNNDSLTDLNDSQFLFNIYESSLDYDRINVIDSLDLDFVPYQLTHALYNTGNYYLNHCPLKMN